MTRGERSSFRGKLTLLMLAAVLFPLISSSLLLVYILERGLQRSYDSQLAASLETLSLIIDNRESELERGLTRLATDNTMQMTLDLDIVSQLRRYLDQQRETLGFAGLTVFDPEGDPIAFSGESLAALFDRPFSLEAVGDRVQLLGMAPITRNDQLLGTLAGALRLTSREFIGYLDNKLVDDYAIWVDDTLCATSVAGIRVPRAAAPPAERQVSEWLLGGEKHLMRVRSREIDGRLFTWGVSIPVQAQASERRMALLLIAAMELGLFVILMAALRRFMRGLVTPLILLTRAVENMRHDDPVPDLEVDRDDEIGQLAASFKALHQSFSDRRSEQLRSQNECESRLRELRNVMDAIPDLIVVKDGENRYVDVNRAFLDLAGVAKGRILGRRDEELVLLIETAESNARDREVIESGRHDRRDEFLRTSANVRILYDTVRIPARSGAGEVDRLIRISRERVTEDTAAALVADGREEADPPREVELSPDGRPHGRILLAEDDLFSRELVARFLEKAGYEVREVGDGQEAVDVFGERRASDGPFDLILMDMQMPRMDGDEAVARIRKMGFAGPIIALTGSILTGDGAEFREMGCDDVVTKPIRMGKLVEVVTRHIEKARAEAQLTGPDRP